MRALQPLGGPDLNIIEIAWSTTVSGNICVTRRISFDFFGKLGKKIFEHLNTIFDVSEERKK
jgi:hypothetical protein